MRIQKILRLFNSLFLTLRCNVRCNWLAISLAISLLCIFAAGSALADPGGLDDYGGHFSKKTGGYHYHKPKARMAKVKKLHLAWLKKGVEGELKGQVVKIERPDAIWVKIDYRPAYQEMARLLPKVNRDDRKLWVKVWFRFVSPEASVNRGKEFNDWFLKKAKYDLGRKLMGKNISLQFKITPNPSRIYGMAFIKDENINLWMVLNGLSYLMINQGKNPHENQFIEAEALARKQEVGLWKKPR